MTHFCAWWPLNPNLSSGVTPPIPLEVDPEGDALFMESAQPFDDHFRLSVLPADLRSALIESLSDFVDPEPETRDFGPELADRARAARRAGLTNWTGR